MNPLKVVAIVGPTGVGKTAAAAEVCRHLEGEIVSADSMQVYRGMDIGTDKASKELRREIPHHLIDVAGFTDAFSVALYQELAREAIADISGRGRLPVLVGGSGLYIRAAVDPLEFPDGKVGSPLRRSLDAAADAEPDALWERLRAVDPSAADKIPRQNVRRVIRALEVIEGGGLFSQHQRGWTERLSIYDTLFIGLTIERKVLYERIDKRVDLMVSAGLLDEVQGLIGLGIEASVTAKQALGYKEMISYLRGDYNLDEAVELIKRRTRQFAKRQMTWFKADHRINWIDTETRTSDELADCIIELVNNSGFIVR